MAGRVGESGYWAKLREVMSDQQEHDIFELMAAIRPMVRPESAFRRGWNKSRLKREGRTPEDLTVEETQGVIRSGIRDVVRSCLFPRKVHGYRTSPDVVSSGPYGHKIYRWVPRQHECVSCHKPIGDPRPMDQRVLCGPCVRKQNEGNLSLSGRNRVTSNDPVSR